MLQTQKEMKADGIDYGLGQTNIDTKTGIRYGVIHQGECLQAWADSSEPYYGPEDELSELSENEWEGMEPISWYYSGEGIEAEQSFDDGDIFILKSPYYTLCGFCSPCAPGAGYLTGNGNVRAYCFGPDWFEGKPPHDIYRVSDGKLVASKA